MLTQSTILSFFAGSVGANASVSRVGLYGAASLRTVLQPGESKSLTIIMSWYYPHRDIARLHVGNFYSNLFSSSKDVALHMRRDLLPSIKGNFLGRRYNNHHSC